MAIAFHATEVCAACGAQRTDPTRLYFPLWFEGEQHQPLCPNCVPGRPVTPQLTVITARALPAAATHPQDMHHD